MKLSTGSLLAKHRAVAILFVLTTFLLISYDLSADSLRCGRKVVLTGDSSSVLLEKCGQPRFKDRAVERVKLKDGRKEVRVERWHYQKSSRGLSRAVLIFQGNVVGIQ